LLIETWKKIRKYEPKYPYPHWISEDFKSSDDFMDSWSYSQLKYNTKSKTLTGDVIRHEYAVRRRPIVNNEKQNILFANYHLDSSDLNEPFIGLSMDDI
jgi:hypothetical protein